MTRRTAAWMPLYIEAYDRKTIDLSPAEDGVYLRLLRHYWVSGPLPDDDIRLARIARVERREWSKLRPAVIGFFLVQDGRWFQSRAEEELAKAREVSEKRHESGSKGGRPKKQRVPEEIPIGSFDGKQTGTHARVASPLPSEVHPPAEEHTPDTYVSVGDAATKKRGHRLPPDWSPSLDDQAFALDEGFSPQEITRAADEFRDFWRARTGRDATKLDWSATWRNRIRELTDRRQRSGPRLVGPPGQSRGGGSVPVTFADLVLGGGDEDHPRRAIS